MRRIAARVATALVLCLLVPGCAARFSPETIRSEIARQRGADPLGVFELNLGRFTTMLMQSVLTTADGEVPFAGLRELQLAVYESPSESGPAIDVTRIGVKGWEPVIRAHDDARSALVLVRAPTALAWVLPDAPGTVADLVVVGAGRRKVVYARLRGNLNGELPTALGDLLRDGGPEELRRVLTEMALGQP